MLNLKMYVEAVEKDIPQQHKIISTIYDDNNNLNPNPVTEADIKIMYTKILKIQ